LNEEPLKETESVNSISQLSDNDLPQTKRQETMKPNENDSLSGIMKKRNNKNHQISNKNLDSNEISQIENFKSTSVDLGRSIPVVTFKSHYSPKTSVKIKVIDETDTDYDN
jgi:hypothetical protein